MDFNFEEINLLEKAEITSGEKWIYSADANDPGLNRIDEEIDDLKQISSMGGIVAILAHEGRFGKAKPLDNVSKHLAEKLKVDILYFNENNSEAAKDFLDGLKPGQLVVMGNTRFHEGEEKNDANLSKQFSSLGNKVGLGGFGKAHRANASNVGILEFLPGFLARSQVRAMNELTYFAGKSEKYSVAVLGGVKGEKIKDGLAGFVETYDAVIPGGIVLNTILKVNGTDIGDSKIDDDGKTFEKPVLEILKKYSGKVIVPELVVIARKEEENYVDIKEIKASSSVPKGYMIVDFKHTANMLSALEKAVLENGRIVMAGTPGIFVKKNPDKSYNVLFKDATIPVVEYMKRNPDNSIALGGDTAGEIKGAGIEYNGKSSSGGGSSLYYIAYGTTPLLEALKKNKNKFS